MKAVLERPGVRYVVVGGSVYLLELLVIVLAQYWGRTPVQAVALAFFIGLIVSFLLQKLVTFSDKRTHHKILIPQIIAVTLLVLFNLCFTLLVTRLLQDSWPAVVSRTLALGVTTSWNFYLYKTRIFKNAEVPVY
jgi:putative flippase GtrA